MSHLNAVLKVVGVFLSGALLNYALIYSLVTGKMIGRRTGLEGIEARYGFSVGYWIYVAGVGIAAIAFDVWVLWIIRNAWRDRGK